jgi:thiol:disulfide interchange protein DsbC
MMQKSLRSATALLLAAAFLTPALADEAAIRKNIKTRVPALPQIDEVTKTVIPGIYEVRMGTDVIYTDERGDHIFQGDLIDTESKVNLTQARVDKLTAIDFAQLALKDAIVWKQGTGARKLAIFADPNCGYCKHFEQTLQQVKDVTVYTFLIPILGGDSPQKSRDIWCSKDNSSAWRGWMLNGASPMRSMGQCDTGALDRNIAMSKKFKINATPSLIFEDGKRVAGALAMPDVEKQFVASKAKG